MLRLTLMLCSHFKLQWDDPSSTASRLCNQLGCPFVRHMRVSVDMSLASVMLRFIHMTMWLRRCPRKTWRACWSSSSTRILQTAEATKQTQRLHFYSAVNGVQYKVHRGRKRKVLTTACKESLTGSAVSEMLVLRWSLCSPPPGE